MPGSMSLSRRAVAMSASASFSTAGYLVSASTSVLLV